MRSASADGTVRRPGASWRTLRLASGLVLFAYVLTHLLNQALGNVSLAAMEWGLDWAGALWWQPVAQVLLYGAFAAHLALGLWALYRRRPFRYRPKEALQLGLGLLIPLLLVQHIVGTRLAFELEGIDRRFTQLLALFFVDSPGLGALQAATLVVVWCHGCIGLYFWLSLKRWFPPVAPLLLCVAVLVPALALLGTVQGGRQVAALWTDPAWRAAHFGTDRVGTSGQDARLAAIRLGLTLGYLLLVAATLGARGLRRLLEARRGIVTLTYPDGRSVRVSQGTSVLEASQLFRIPHASVCGGRGRCSTCRIQVLDGGEHSLPAPSAAEQAVLDRIGAEGGVRLACQLRPRGALVVVPLLAPGANAAEAAALGHAAFGEERFVVAMFVDLRGSTRLAERRLPYDTVFLINRFLEAVSGGVVEAGGEPNQFLGDGMLALFGLRVGPREAAAAALESVGHIARNVAALNGLLARQLDEPLRFGIGLHGGTAILGHVGNRSAGRAVFTAIGDPVNVASRLQGLTKPMGVELLVSDTVFATAGRAPDTPAEAVAVAGRDGGLRVHRFARAEDVLTGDPRPGMAVA